MAIERRTRAQKEKAALHRTGQAQIFYQYRDRSSLSAGVENPLVAKTLSQSPNRQTNVAQVLFPYDLRFIYQDLRKTLLFTAIMFIILGMLTKILN